MDGLTPWTKAVIKGIVRQFKEEGFTYYMAAAHIIPIFQVVGTDGNQVYPPWTKDQICDYVENVWNEGHFPPYHPLLAERKQTMLIKFTVTKADWKKGCHGARNCPFATAITRAIRKATDKPIAISVDGSRVWIRDDSTGWVPATQRILLPEEAREVIRQWDQKEIKPDKAQTFQIDVPNHLLTP